ncbi:MAG: hypothetical protein KIT80_11300 [Chitinophagaceae bacterium]|nr:hypothetical protein [Chitinophagaceae bacterium]MCW5927487.1 hypothetical protein [Chitinophagaceae bacterium]
MKRLLCLISVFLPFAIYAQSASEWQKAQWRQNTVLFDNPAFLADADSINSGNTGLEYFSGKNRLRDAFMPEKSSGFTIQSERYLSNNDWVIYGKFLFSKYEEFQTRMTSMTNPYRDNPYQIADSSFGDWRKQHYLLQAKVVSPKINRYMRAGTGIKYEVLNGARQKDPRPLDKTINIELTPSIMFDITGKWKLGLNGYYNRLREDLSISLENHLRPKDIFKLNGLGEYLYNGPIILGSLSRAYEGNNFGGGVSIGYDFNARKKIRSIISYKNNMEKITDGTTTPFNGGRHQYNDVEASVVYSIASEQKEHLISLNVLNRNISNTEFVQIYNTSSQQYEVIHQAVMNTKTRSEGSLHYRLLLNNQAGQLNWILGARVYISNADEQYPSTSGLEQITLSGGTLEAGKWIQLRNGQLNLRYTCSYRAALNSDLQYVPKTFSNNFAAYRITYPNFYYNTLNHLFNSLDLQYSFGISKLASQLYLKASYIHHANTGSNAYYNTGLNNHFYSITLGLFN